MTLKYRRWALLVCLTALSAGSLHAAYHWQGPVKISRLMVNGGSNSLNSGTSCMQLTPAANAACAGGWVAIPNNDRSLLAAAMQAKAMNASIDLDYETQAPADLHCPYQVFTRCSLQNIHLR